MNERQKVYEMLDRFESAMLVTHNADGTLDARPMRVAEVEPAGALWFLTSRSSRKVNEIAGDARVLLVYEDDNQYLSIAGTARVVDDGPRTRRLWKEPRRPTSPASAWRSKTRATCTRGCASDAGGAS